MCGNCNPATGGVGYAHPLRQPVDISAISDPWADLELAERLSIVVGRLAATEDDTGSSGAQPPAAKDAQLELEAALLAVSKRIAAREKRANGE